MRPGTRLDSAVFKLTPTRTRCDLVIIANGKTEKIASGLFNPFLGHLKTAQDQINKGGYSVTLEPSPESDAAWFTKGTVERFVRFVSTPEVLERVTTIESEILQIEDAMAIQSNDNLGFSAVHDHQTKLAEGNGGSKATGGVESEKAMVIYKPGSQPQLPDSNGSSTQENSKVKLLEVLETRKIVLQKEQGMAFARAAAAGFDMNNMADLISFAQSFGAVRLMEACIKFMDLWKKKHETGQWVDVEVAEIASRSEFSYLNASGIVIAEDMLRQKEQGETIPLSGGDAVSKTNGNVDKEMLSEPKMLAPPEYFQGQFQHPAYPQWNMHSHLGPAVFQPYTMQGMPYYHNYPGGMSYVPPPYPPTEDPRYDTSHQGRMRRHSMDNSNIEPETWERSTRSQDGTDENLSDMEKESARGRESLRKSTNSGKKKSGVVVENLNYITSMKHGAPASKSESTSYSESEETEDLHSNTHRRKHKSSKKVSKKEESHTKCADNSSTYDKEGHVVGQEADSGNWQAFQNFLLKAEEKARAADNDMFPGEKAPSMVKKQNKSELEHNFLHGRDNSDANEQRMVEFDPVNGQAWLKKASSNDALLISNGRRVLVGGQLKGMEGGRGAYRRMSNDDFMIYGQDKHYNNKKSSDPLTDQAHQLVGGSDKSSSHDKTDESFLLPHRSGFQDRTTMDIDSELPSSRQNPQDNNRPKVQTSYEPYDLSLVPQRGNARGPINYDPALDYGVQLPVENAKTPDGKTQHISTNTKEEVKKSEKKNSRALQDSLKRKETMVKKATSSRIYPSAEAQKRAEKLRAFKGDLQKIKKEQEEENVRRLEALRIERQKRIAARSASNVTQSTTTPQQTKARLASKVSPGSYKGSKFSDVEPRSSPLGKLPARTTSVGSSAQKVQKTSRLNGNSQRLTRSVSSLADAKKENDGLSKEAKTASLRIRRLSEPKGSYVRGASARNYVPNNRVAKKVRDESQKKKITAIIQLDQSKSATLPELKIKSSKTILEVVQKKSQTGTGSKSSQVSHSVESRYDNRPSRRRNSEDNLIIEKTVVMLENNVTPSPIIQLSQGSVGTNEKSCTKTSPVYAGILALPSPKVASQVEDSTASKLDERLNSVEVAADYSKNVQKFSKSMVTQKPYQAPHARVSSMDPVTNNVGYMPAAPVPETGRVMTHSESIKAQVSSFEDSSSVNQAQGTSEKLHNEAKGFRKFLKFGRKSPSSFSGEGSHDSDASSFDKDAVTAVSSDDAHLLKHLLSQDDTHTECTPTKAPPPFSLLSPFRNKSSEKKRAS